MVWKIGFQDLLFSLSSYLKMKNVHYSGSKNALELVDMRQQACLVESEGGLGRVKVTKITDH